MKINVHNYTQNKDTKIKKVLKNCFDPIEEKKEMQIILVTEEEIRRLNDFFRKIDKITDVLSFPDEEDDESLGDIFICLKRAEEQAISNGHSFEREISFLAVHGYLHLIGYDHQSVEEEKDMIKMQKEILGKANLERTKK
ncbi:rRNA maturation RNase YbeY [Acholeplasma sp. OttesenSCG-928-E16]|nr:rRNA maturation RNase YbeY [Acholeplasma sp. OttesenSCG-928-E16]